MQTLQIRPFAAPDLPAVVQMAHDLAAYHDDTAQLTLETLARDALGPAPWLPVLVAERENDLVGYAALCPLAQLQFGVRGMDIHHLFVVEAARGDGVGRALIESAVDFAKSQSCAYVTVGTHPDNQLAGNIYESVGFERLPPSGPRFRIML